MLEDTVARFSVGLQRFQSGDHQGAVSAFSEAIAVNPQFEPAYRMRSEAYVMLGFAEQAESDLETVISITDSRLKEARSSLKKIRKRSTPRSVVESASPEDEPQSTVEYGSEEEPAQGQGIPLDLSFLMRSPIILGTAVVSMVLILGALGLIIIGGN